MDDTPLWKTLQGKCVHFNGTINETCEIGISYLSVRDESAHPYRFPCIRWKGEEAATVCEHARFPTEVQAKAEAKRLDDRLREYLDKAQSGICPQCDTPIQRERQVGRCVYADPCGHRLWQGRAKDSDEINAAMLM